MAIEREIERETQILNDLENVIALNDDGQLDVKHLRKVASAIVEAHDKIDWEKIKEDVKMFRIESWIPVKIEPEEDLLYTEEEAKIEKAHLEAMQPENIYEIKEENE